MADLHLIVVAADSVELLPFRTLKEPAMVTLVANPERVPLGEIGNRYLKDAACPVIGLVHADTSFAYGALEVFTRAALDGAVVGLVGIDNQRTYRWSKDNPGEVSTLDSCSVFLRRDSGLQFDSKTFNGMHCHVEDICLQARAKGIPVMVPSAKANHIGRRTALPEWQAEYWGYRAKLAAKWAGVPFQTT